MNSPRHPLTALLLGGLLLLIPNALAQGNSATWNLNPISGEWNDPLNWTPYTVPNGPTDTATFDVPNITSVSVSADTQVSTAFAQSVAGNLNAVSGNLNTANRILPKTNTIYQTNYRSDTVEVFSLRGSDLGVFARPAKPTGLVFDNAGNLYVSSDDLPRYAILKFAPDGSESVFADSGLSGPHALVFDRVGNLYVANAANDTIEKFSSDGVGTVFADTNDSLATPLDLAFDTAGNLYVTNAYGGPAGNGSVLKFTPDGVGSVFADSGFHTAYGLALDRDGNIYVSNFSSSTIEKFSPTGEDLGLFASTGLDLPHGMIFDRSGNLYVANNGNSTIEKFSSTGVDLGVFARTGGGPHFLTMFRPRRLHFHSEH